MIWGMTVGALIFITGFIGGYQATIRLRRQKNIYDKYKNPDGLYSRKAVRKEGR